MKTDPLPLLRGQLAVAYLVAFGLADALGEPGAERRVLAECVECLRRNLEAASIGRANAHLADEFFRASYDALPKDGAG